ncbi:MAG TPA: cytochrome P460 family protein [Candidatus Binatia bacterium]|nr:cytochrome P460 family protein [Candidatus Binatia bacterium]
MRTLVTLVSLATALAASAADVPRPTEYRHWTHVKTMVILPGHPLAGAFGGMHDVYVNDAGLPALRHGGPFADGTTFVFDLFESSEQDHAFVAGARKVTAVMVKDRARFPKTGGWGFQAFAPGDGAAVVKDPAGECFGCHQSREKTDFVFSHWTD